MRWAQNDLALLQEQAEHLRTVLDELASEAVLKHIFGTILSAFTDAYSFHQSVRDLSTAVVNATWVLDNDKQRTELG